MAAVSSTDIKLTPPLTRQASRRITVIEPVSGWGLPSFAEVWRFRELLLFMVLRDVRIRYKQTILGLLWAFIQPFMTMVVFTVFFGSFAGIPSDGIPYPIFSYAGLIPWTFFSSGLVMVANSIVTNSSMMKKIYMPRVIYPMANLASTGIDFVLSFLIVIVMIVLYFVLPQTDIWQTGIVSQFAGVEKVLGVQAGIQITWRVILLPLFFAMVYLTTLAFGLWLAAFNVRFRDVRHATSFIVRIWMFITPIIYPTTLVAENWRFLYSFNPMTGVVDGFRWALLGVGEAPVLSIVLGCIVTAVVLITGLIYFDHMEKSFADIV